MGYNRNRGGGRNNAGGGGGRGRRRHQQAWAPYNFVPMPDKPVYAELDEEGIPQRHDVYSQGRHTGYFDITLKTETPLFVRGMLTVAEQEGDTSSREKANAFSIDGNRPVIPGSSLRGMIRTLVEIVTRSKMHFVTDNKLVYRSVFGNDSLAQNYRAMVAEQIGRQHFMYPSNRIQGGYLMRGNSSSGWVIRPAQRYQNESFVLVNARAVQAIQIPLDQHQETYDVFVRPATRDTYQNHRGLRLELAETQNISTQARGGLEPAKLIVSGFAPRRHWFAAIYSAREDASQDMPISIEIWDNYKTDRDMQRGIATRKIGEGDPLFYLVDENNQLVFFGPTMFFRLPYRNSISQMINRLLQKRNPRTDYAEAMFGYVSEQDEKRQLKAYAGRVSVTSAHVVDELADYYDATIVPRILGSPKPTTFQHYLEQPNGWRTETQQLLHYGDDTLLRGYKLYWRQMIESLESVREPDTNKNPQNSTQHTRIRPVRKEVRFHFRVYFENLSDMELGALIWVLTFGGDERARHQLGMGKPFGLGVVKLEPELILTSRTDRYARLFDENGKWYKAEQRVTAEDQEQFVTMFKQRMGGFDNDRRIRELMALVRMQEANPSKFSYMQIESTSGNDYDGRPVLPYPTEVID